MLLKVEFSGKREMIIIKNKSECCGCSACYSICPKACITLQEDNEGFRYPIVNTDICIDCHLCEVVCPIINYKNENKHPLVFGLRNKNVFTQKLSSSGGVFFSLAEYTISRGGIVFGVIYDENLHVIYHGAETIEECRKFHGSKYVESYIPDNLFRDIQLCLKRKREVLFVGTPCHVAGLKNFLRKKYDNLLTCDLICSSVPSPRIYKDYLNFAQRKKNIRSINMRWKEDGWNKPKQQIVYSDGQKLIGKGDAKLWHTIAFTHLVSRPSCHKCCFTNFNRPADFSIGDFWGIETSHPNFFDKKGVSLLLINTEKGKKIFEILKDQFFIQPSTEECCSQPRLLSPVMPNMLREQFWKEYNPLKFESIAKKYWRYGKWNRCKYLFRFLLSKIYRLIVKIK